MEAADGFLTGLKARQRELDESAAKMGEVLAKVIAYELDKLAAKTLYDAEHQEPKNKGSEGKASGKGGSKTPTVPKAPSKPKPKKKSAAGSAARTRSRPTS